MTAIKHVLVECSRSSCIRNCFSIMVSHGNSSRLFQDITAESLSFVQKHQEFSLPVLRLAKRHRRHKVQRQHRWVGICVGLHEEP